MVTVTTWITSRSDCRALRAAGLPDVAAGHRLPDDLADFYAACGGADLFVGKEVPVRICTPDELVPSNPEIVGEQVPDDITSSWHVVARGGSGEHLSIDLHPGRLGLCYDSFVEVHGVAGSSAVVATSFTDLCAGCWPATVATGTGWRPDGSRSATRTTALSNDD